MSIMRASVFSFMLINSVFFLPQAVLADRPASASYSEPFEEWVRFQNQVSIERMLQNISPPGAAPGIVVASPSSQSPDYLYHWTRDASLVIDEVIELFRNSSDQKRNLYLKPIQDFILLSKRQQLEPSADGLGEPRYRIDGSADTTEWARPQYDGPALRALTLLRFLGAFSSAHPSKEEASLRAITIEIIRKDLDFVFKTWNQPCFDLWEELRGQHFYTQAVQRAALGAGADFFLAEGEVSFASHLRAEAFTVGIELEKYWDEKTQYIRASLSREEREGMPNYKDENLDTSVILAALHSNINQGLLSFSDDRLLATAHALEKVFAKEYAINRGENIVAIGRFADDIYFGGNPWYMTTAAFAELYYRVAQTFSKNGTVTITENNIHFFQAAVDLLVSSGDGSESRINNLELGQKILVLTPVGQKLLGALHNKGDSFLAVIRKYSGDQGKMSEQFDRDAGVPVSAYDLTWSYASFLSATRQRTR